MDFAFVPDNWPEEYRGDAIVALKGSWNRVPPTGYKLVRVKFENGEPAGWYENFLAGFWIEGERRATVWGRPAIWKVSPSDMTHTGATGNTDKALQENAPQ